MEALVVIRLLILLTDGCLASDAGVNKDMIVQLMIEFCRPDKIPMLIWDIIKTAAIGIESFHATTELAEKSLPMMWGFKCANHLNFMVAHEVDEIVIFSKF